MLNVPLRRQCPYLRKMFSLKVQLYLVYEDSYVFLKNHQDLWNYCHAL